MGSNARAWLLACLVFAAPASAELNLEMVEPSEEMPLEAKPEMGVKVRAGGGQGGTAMHWMAFNGDKAGVRRLIISGAEIDDRLKTGGTPMHLAAYNGHVGVVKLLIEHGASVNARTKAGITPLDWARRNGHEAAAMLLIAHGGKASRASPPRPEGSDNAAASSDGEAALKPAFSPRRKSPLKYNLYLVPEDSVVVNRGVRDQAPVQETIPVGAKDKTPVPEQQQAKAPVREEPTEPPLAREKRHEPAPEREQRKTEAQATQSSPRGTYRIQLGAFSSEQRAQGAWSLYRKKYPELLDSRELLLDKTSVKGKSFYRVQTGPMSRSDARGICDRLKQAGQSCAVMKRDSS